MKSSLVGIFGHDIDRVWVLSSSLLGVVCPYVWCRRDLWWWEVGPEPGQELHGSAFPSPRKTQYDNGAAPSPALCRTQDLGWPKVYIVLFALWPLRTLSMNFKLYEFTYCRKNEYKRIWKPHLCKFKEWASALIVMYTVLSWSFVNFLYLFNASRRRLCVLLGKKHLHIPDSGSWVLVVQITILHVEVDRCIFPKKGWYTSLTCFMDKNNNLKYLQRANVTKILYANSIAVESWVFKRTTSCSFSPQDN